MIAQAQAQAQVQAQAQAQTPLVKAFRDWVVPAFSTSFTTAVATVASTS